MKKITIGIFNDSFFPMMDGVCMVVDNYAKRLSKIANVIVFVPEYNGRQFDDTKLDYKVVRCKSKSIPFLDYSLPIPYLDRKFIKELKSYKLDIVHIHSPFTLGKVGLKYAKKNNIPVVATMHSQFKQDFKRAVKLDSFATILNKSLIKVFDRCDECWAVNSEVARIFYEDYKCKKMPRVMNNATGMEPIKNKKEAYYLVNKKYSIDNNVKVFLFVGRINNLKNVFFIVDSLKILKEKAPNFKFKMLFVGSGQDENELKQVINKNELENDVVMCGKITDRELLANYYARADLFLFPSMYDASSIVQIEAASQNTPTVFLEGSATSATITNNINGFISENSKEKYADKIIEIMNDDKLYKKVCENAYKDLYVSWDDKVKEVYNLYVNIIKKKN